MEINLPDKIYYRINEVARAFDVNASLIRYWEKEFSFLIKPKKNGKGERLFTKKDIENLKLIYHLVKENGYTLDGAKKKLRQKRQKVNKNISIIERLENIKKELIDIKNKL
jgi:DNA-binding transcriptional MerR regulator